MAKTRFEDFLDFAILNESEAARLYETSAGVCNLPVQKQLLEKMAAMERGHEMALKKIREGGSSSLLGRKTGIDLTLAEFMVPVTLTPDSPLEDVLIFSIKAEQKAFELYHHLEELEEDPATKSLLQKLAGEEKKHKADLEALFEKKFMNEN